MSLTGCTRLQAEGICNQLDGTLAKMENQSDLELAKLEMNKVESAASFHIGLTNEVRMFKLSFVKRNQLRFILVNLFSNLYLVILEHKSI